MKTLAIALVGLATLAAVPALARDHDRGDYDGGYNRGGNYGHGGNYGYGGYDRGPHYGGGYAGGYNRGYGYYNSGYRGPYYGGYYPRGYASRVYVVPPPIVYGGYAPYYVGYAPYYGGYAPPPVYSYPTAYAYPEPVYGGGYRCRTSGRGTVLGAIAGGLIGNATSNRYNRGAATIVGAGVGAVAGTAIDSDC